VTYFTTVFDVFIMILSASIDYGGDTDSTASIIDRYLAIYVIVTDASCYQ